MEQFVNLVSGTSKEKVSYDIEKYKLENVLNENVEIYTKFLNSDENTK